MEKPSICKSFEALCPYFSAPFLLPAGWLELVLSLARRGTKAPSTSGTVSPGWSWATGTRCPGSVGSVPAQHLLSEWISTRKLWPACPWIPRCWEEKLNPAFDLWNRWNDPVIFESVSCLWQDDENEVLMWVERTTLHWAGRWKTKC